LRKISTDSYASVIAGLIALLSAALPWSSSTVQAFGLASTYRSLLDEYIYWSSLPSADPQTAVLLDANTKVLVAAAVLVLVVAGGVIGLAGVKWRVARLLACACIVAGLVAFEYMLRPFRNQFTVYSTNRVMVANTAPSWGFIIAALSVFILLYAFLRKSNF